MKTPEDIRWQIATRYRRHCREWLAGGGEWPLTFSLGCPSEKEAGQVDDWMKNWRQWPWPGQIQYVERQWRYLGAQQLPGSLTLSTPEEAALVAGQETAWRKARLHYDLIVSRWPSLSAAVAKNYSFFTEPQTDVQDVTRLIAVLEWLLQHPASNLYPRQLPVAGMDTKWLDNKRSLLAEFLQILKNDNHSAGDFFQICGLKNPAPKTVRLRVLDSALRKQIGGLGDLTVSGSELARCDLRPARVYIVENQQCALAMDDVTGSVVIFGLGYHTDILAEVPWLSASACYYWGDIDTHGFAILNRVRAHAPNITSLLMTEEVLLSHRPLWSVEESQHADVHLPRLTAEEHAVYQNLRRHVYGDRVRLEQERIAWNEAWPALRAGDANFPSARVAV